MPIEALPPRQARYLSLLDQGIGAAQRSDVDSQLRADRILGILERHTLEPVKPTDQSLVVVGKESEQPASLGLLVSTAHDKFIQAALNNNPLADEAARLAFNRVIATVNELRRTQAIVSGAIAPLTNIPNRTPQLPAVPRRDLFEKPGSPTLPHNGLGTFAGYRSEPDSRFITAITRQIQAISGESPDEVPDTAVAKAVLSLISTSIIHSPDRSISEPKELAAFAVSLANTIRRYDTGELSAPTAEELGEPGPKQDMYIALHLRSLLAYYMYLELAQPNRTEQETQKLYRKLNDDIRAVAKFINPLISSTDQIKSDRQIDTVPGLRGSYERVGKIIEGMQGIDGVMLSARCSTNLWMDLGLPCLDYTEEVRVAEVLRNIANKVREFKSHRSLQTAGGFKLDEVSDNLFTKIIWSVDSRMEDDTFNCQTFFECFASLDYGKEMLKQLFDVADDDQKDILFIALQETDHFDPLKREIARER